MTEARVAEDVQRRTLAILAAFAAVYLIWGSTYLAIRFVVEDIPPFLSASVRWLVAGAILFAWRASAGDAMPTWRQLRSASIVGVLLILGGNGLVSWAEQWVPSALAALLIAIVPMWIALMVWGRTKVRPNVRVSAGILLGFAGVVALFAPTLVGGLQGATALLAGTIAVLVATVSWATGSLYSRTAELPKSTLMSVSLQMLTGGVALGIVAVATGEPSRFEFAAITMRAWISLAFLIVFGSIVAFSAYIWLFREVQPSLAATYAFVNPVVAVILGAVLAGETFTPLTVAASALIVIGVALVVTAPRPVAPPPVPPADA